MLEWILLLLLGLYIISPMNVQFCNLLCLRMLSMTLRNWLQFFVRMPKRTWLSTFFLCYLSSAITYVTISVDKCTCTMTALHPKFSWIIVPIIEANELVNQLMLFSRDLNLGGEVRWFYHSRASFQGDKPGLRSFDHWKVTEMSSTLLKIVPFWRCENGHRWCHHLSDNLSEFFNTSVSKNDRVFYWNENIGILMS